MQNPLQRKPKPYVAERTRILEYAVTLKPDTDEYHKVMQRLDTLDKINKRSYERTKAIIPALGTVGAVGGIYALQQFGGILVPKVVDAIVSRREAKNEKETE